MTRKLAVLMLDSLYTAFEEHVFCKVQDCPTCNVLEDCNSWQEAAAKILSLIEKHFPKEKT